jgi:general stress protein 26
MTSWQGFTEQAPDLAAAVLERFEAHQHKTMATVRADGGPRISGTEVALLDGDLWLGGMVGSRRFADLRRDPRVAVHSGSDEPDVWQADAKVSGVAVEVVDEAVKAALREQAPDTPPGDFELFRIDLREATLVRLDDARTGLVVETWRDGQGVRSVVRT